jgi:hypothetical protein
MDPRHTLYRTLENLTIDPEAMSARTDQEAASVQATSGVTPEGIEKKLREGLAAEYVEIADLSGTLIFLSVPSKLWRIYVLVLSFLKFYRSLRAPLSAYLGSNSVSVDALRHHEGANADTHDRRMRPNVRSHHRITTIHQKDNPSTTQTSQRSP